MRQLDLLKDNENKIFFHYLFPAICSTLITSIYVLVDTLIIGRGVGALGISALNIFLPVFQVLNGIGLLFGIGSGILISSSIGSGDKKKADKFFITGLTVVISISICLWIFLSLNLENICIILGADKNNLDLVLEYARCIAGFAPTFILANYFSPIIRNLKNPKLVMIAVFTGSVINIILDYVFVFPMQMGMFGAALATVLGSITTVIILLFHFVKKSNRIKITNSTFSLKLIKPIVNCGLASLLMELASGFVIFIFNIQILKYIGNNGIVIYGIISNCVIVGSALFNGVAQAIQPIIATNYGANIEHRVKKILNYGFITSTAIGLCLFTLVYLFSEQIINIFVVADSNLLKLGIPAVRIYLSTFCIMNLNIIISSYLQSIGREKASIFISLTRGFLLNILFAVLLPILFPASILWIIVPASELITLVGTVIFYKVNNPLNNSYEPIKHIA